jgi:hypothetical protein
VEGQQRTLLALLYVIELRGYGLSDVGLNSLLLEQ